MDSIEQEKGIELSRVSSFAHPSAAATGFRMWSLIIAIMLSMLLLGLDINIVATVSVPSFSHDSMLLLTNVLSGHSHYLQRIPQYRGYQLVWLRLPLGHVSSAQHHETPLLRLRIHAAVLCSLSRASYTLIFRSRYDVPTPTHLLAPLTDLVHLRCLLPHLRAGKLGLGPRAIKQPDHQWQGRLGHRSFWSDQWCAGHYHSNMST